MGTIFLLFAVFFVLFFVVMFRAAKLNKNSKVTTILVKIVIYGGLIFALYWLFFHPTPWIRDTCIGILLGLENLALAIGTYGLNKRHIRQLKTVLFANAAFILFYDSFLSSLTVPLPKLWTNVICVVEWGLISQNFGICLVMRRMRDNYYRFLKIHGEKYMVYNEFPILFDYNESNYKVIKVPIVGEIDLGNNWLITNEDGQEKYTIKVGMNTYEIRNDFNIQVEKNNEINFVVITVNETPIAVTTGRISILEWCKEEKKLGILSSFFCI